MIRKAYKFRIYPNNTQKIELAKHFGYSCQSLVHEGEGVGNVGNVHKYSGLDRSAESVEMSH